MSTAALARGRALPAAAALLCLVLVACSAADNERVITDGFTSDNAELDKFNYIIGDTEMSLHATVDVNVNNPRIKAGGVSITGYGVQPPSNRKPIVITFTAPVFENGGLVASGWIFPHSIMNIRGGSADMQSDIPVFDISTLQMVNNVSFTVVNFAAKYKNAVTSAVVRRENDVVSIGLSHGSRLHLVGITASGASSVIRVRSHTLMSIVDNALVAVDYSSCTNCVSGIADIETSIRLADSSVLRITYNRGEGTTNLAYNGVDPTFSSKIDVYNESLFVIQDNVLEGSGGFLISGAELSVSEGSKATIANNNASAEAKFSDLLIPTDVDAKSRFYVYNNRFGGKPSPNDRTVGLDRDNVQVLSDDGTQPGSKDTCAQATCIPKNTVSPQQPPCRECACKQNTYESMCTDIPDLANLFLSCDVENCEECVAGNAALCRQCNSGFAIAQGGGSCVRISCTDPHCVVCASALECMECDAFYGLIGSAAATKKCAKCADPLCMKCDTDVRRCTDCLSGGGPYPDGTCTKCDVKGCETCIAGFPGICAKCEPGKVVLNGQCVSCNADNCEECTPQHPAQCRKCKSGYVLLPNFHVCSKAACNDPRCVSCVESDECVQCADGSQPVNGQCKGPRYPCNDASCLDCKAGDPNICVSCRSGFVPSGAKCVEDCLKISPNCATCSIPDPLKCQTCKSGFAIDSNGMCQTCSLEGCARCSPQTAGYCLECKSGFTLASGVCSPNTPKDCNVPYCEQCNRNNPERCRICKPGYHVCKACGTYRCKRNGSGAEHSRGATALASTLAGVGLLYALSA